MGSVSSSQQCALHRAYRGSRLRFQVDAQAERAWALPRIHVAHVPIEGDGGTYSLGLARLVHTLYNVYHMHIAYDHHHLLKPSARPEMPLLRAVSFIIRGAFGSVWCHRGSSSWGHIAAFTPCSTGSDCRYTQGGLGQLEQDFCPCSAPTVAVG